MVGYPLKVSGGNVPKTSQIAHRSLGDHAAYPESIDESSGENSDMRKGVHARQIWRYS